MTPYQKAGFNELSLFRATSEAGGLKIGEIHWLAEDLGDLCLMVSTHNDDECYSQVPGHENGATCEELPKDADGFYLWDGRESPVPEDWEVSIKLRGGNCVQETIARGLRWHHDLDGRGPSHGDIIAFKPISRPDMPSVAECATGEAEVDDHILETFGPLGEADPHGKSPHESGAKLDAGKNRLGLVLGGFSRALQEVGKVGTYGANKYTDNGWLDVPNGQERYTDAMLRHWAEEASGVSCDKDTNLPHAAHLAWNALARLELALIEAEALEQQESKQ